ncbi:MAG: hypothetical protein ACRDVG_04300 [Jatrophihabitantaceae bacterium]
MATATGTGPTAQMLPRVTFADPIVLAKRARAHRVRFAIAGTLLVLGGAVTQVIALAFATWWQATAGTQHVRLAFADFAPRSWRGFAYVYFSWGAWLIVGLTVGLGIAGCAHWRGARPFRVVAALVGVAASFAPIAALLVFAYQSHSDAFHVVRDYGIGAYLAALGTMATAFGAAAGGAR